ncbi:MAG: Gram-negative bacterial TonB protein C-terminal, partial [Verrucomicrobiota bacterium]
SDAIRLILAQINPEAKGRWLGAGQSEEPPPEGTPKKIPLAGPNSIRSKLVYSPAPQYPNAARSSSGLTKGSGRFLVTFGPNGEVKRVAIFRSTRNEALDRAAIDALRQWKAAPGQEWTLNVPITFQP